MHRFFSAMVCAMFASTATAQESGSMRLAKVSEPDAQKGSATLSEGAPATPSAEAHCVGGFDDAKLRELVSKEAADRGVDQKLALVILNLESKDGQAVNSPKGAKGPMQLMPATAAKYGVQDICDPAQNIHGAVLYLKDLSAEFSGNVMLIAAAYDAGSERVYRANGVPAIAETVRYVASAANQYYGLSSLTQRHGADFARARPGEELELAGANQPATPPKTNSWIGGSVLYVTSDNQGD
jgi:soluble lytic murein transglycosylase-like protein